MYNYSTLDKAATAGDVVATSDALINQMTGMGGKADKDSYNRFVNEPPMDNDEICALYINDWLAKKVVDAIPHDMIRQWRTIDGLTKEELTLFKKAETAFKIKTKVEEAQKWERLKGGGAIIIGIKGSRGANTRLDIDSIEQGSLNYLHVVDKDLLLIPELEDNPSHPNFNQPKYYKINETKIHPSRVIPFSGEVVPQEVRNVYGYWGCSILQKMRAALARVNVAYGAGSAMLHEASIDIISVQGLFNLMGDCSGEAALMRRLTMSNLMKSNHNALIKDIDEEFTKITQNFAGIPDMIREMVIAISGASETPITRLLGISPSGLNATGQSDLVNYYDTVASRQELALGPKLGVLDKILQLHVFGREIDSFESTFNPLWQPNSTEQSEILEKNMEAHEKASTILPHKVILKSIQQEGHYDISDEEIDAQVEKGFNILPTTKPDTDDNATKKNSE